MAARFTSSVGGGGIGLTVGLADVWCVEDEQLENEESVTRRYRGSVPPPQAAVAFDSRLLEGTSRRDWAWAPCAADKPVYKADCFGEDAQSAPGAAGGHEVPEDVLLASAQDG